FFFQPADGIRDFHVTGVQTFALPICARFTLPCVWTKILAGVVGGVKRALAPRRLRAGRREQRRPYISPACDASIRDSPARSCSKIGRASCRAWVLMTREWGHQN